MLIEYSGASNIIKFTIKDTLQHLYVYINAIEIVILFSMFLSQSWCVH